MKQRKLFVFLLFLIFSFSNTSSPFIASSSFISRNSSSIEAFHFEQNINNSCYIVAISSPNEIIIDEFGYKMELYLNGTKETSGAFFDAVFVTDKKELMVWGGGFSEGSKIGKLRYFHFGMGKINFTYDDRSVYEWQGKIGGGILRWPFKLCLPAGKWYFVFVASLFDLSQKEFFVNMTVWINFSEECKNLSIETKEGGKIYALWYGEFNTSLLISKSWRFEMMLNGRKIFYVDDTFIYFFWGFPAAQGFWKIKWIKPNGEVEKLNMIILRGYHLPDVAGKCVAGVGESGEYELITSYLDYSPILFGRNIYASPIYFIGIDAKLP